MSQLISRKSGSAHPVPSSSLQVYLLEISRYPLLEPQEEYDLAVQLFDHGDTTAAQRLVTANLRLVVKIANEFKNAQSNVLDLIQEGNFGLLQAVKRFNPYKGVRLSTYAAWWIKAFILKFIMEHKSQVKIGTTAAQRKLFFNLRKEAEKLLAEYDHVDTKLLAANLNVKEDEVIEMSQRLGGPDISLDAPLNADTTTTHGEVFVQPGESVDDDLAQGELLNIFEDHLLEFKATLKDRELQIFNDRLMAENPLTLQEIGERYGVTRERARQIEAKVIQSLREFVRNKGKIADLIPTKTK